MLADSKNALPVSLGTKAIVRPSTDLTSELASSAIAPSLLSPDCALESLAAFVVSSALFALHAPKVRSARPNAVNVNKFLFIKIPPLFDSFTVCIF